jgi:acetoin utilization protein AcuC
MQATSRPLRLLTPAAQPAGRAAPRESIAVAGVSGLQPLVVHGEWSDRYDFGPGHPLTPRRFGPGIDLLRASGAERVLSPEPAADEDLERLHTPAYIAAVKRLSANPDGQSEAGIGYGGDCPPFRGMHEASAAVAGGSLAAMDAILEGRVEHGFHPGGGLHHAMAARASGFCIYNDVALAVARARDAGHRVLYVDLDVHHGDGTQALFWDDPHVLTFSIHETGLSLFPGTGFVEESGGPSAPGTAVNVPLLPYSGDASWLPAVESVVPALADAFRPTVLVTQHGCDSHALDPLAHLRLTTRAYERASGLLDAIAHRHADGRWLATGGGGYDVYRVVPRSWALVWLVQSHREVAPIPAKWRERWESEAERYGQSPVPEEFIDPSGAVADDPPDIVDANRKTAERALARSLELMGAAQEAR